MYNPYYYEVTIAKMELKVDNMPKFKVLSFGEIRDWQCFH